jgi:hypothetical protein
MMSIVKNRRKSLQLHWKSTKKQALKNVRSRYYNCNYNNEYAQVWEDEKKGGLQKKSEQPDHLLQQTEVIEIWQAVKNSS